MEIFIHENQNTRIAEIITQDIVIKETQDALDIMGESDYRGNRIFFVDNLKAAMVKLTAKSYGKTI